MLTDLHIQNFRSLRALSIEQLTRVNLVVGSNNAGKTSILEAAEALLGSAPRALWGSPVRREEYLADSDERPPEVDIRHVFFGHKLAPGVSFRIEGRREGKLSLECEVVLAPTSAEAEQPSLPLPERAETVSLLALRLQWSGSDSGSESIPLVPLSAEGGLSRESRRRFLTSETSARAPVIMLTPASLGASLLGSLWDSVVLTPEEPRVIEALQLIEPDLERIAAVARSRFTSASILVKLRDSDLRIPLGSMGDGLRYMLSLSMALVKSAGGYLLVDEIDTGLHHSVMGKMWKLVIQNAQRLGSQVIASTHSLDCLRSLASVCDRDPSLRPHVSVHRIERGVSHAVRYSAEELAIAIKQEMEIR